MVGKWDDASRRTPSRSGFGTSSAVFPSINGANGGGGGSRPLADTVNPKDAVGDTKPPLHLIPGPALVEEALVMGNGAWKYGPYNWREKKVRATVYVAAMLRHLHAYLDGANLDAAAATPNAKGENPPHPHVHHVAAVRAGAGILLDAIATGNLIDDRPPPAPTEEIILSQGAPK